MSANCTYTIGFWKTHKEVWPVIELILGNYLYNKQQLLDILNTPPSGNGLITLSHQLITALLNIENGANEFLINPYITQANDLINDLIIPPYGNGFLTPKQTSQLNDILTLFNEGKYGSKHCSTKCSKCECKCP